MKHIEVEVAGLVVKTKLDSRQKHETCTFSNMFRPLVGTSKSPILWVPGNILWVQENIFPCLKPPSPEADRFCLMPRQRMCGGVPTLLHTSSCRGAQVSAGTICTWRQSVDWISRDDTESFICLLNQIYFWRGEFGITCLLLIQKDSNTFTVIICLKYNETDQRKLFLTWLFLGGGGRYKNFEHGIGLPHVKAQKQGQHKYWVIVKA
jgi:hypothetical protein